MSGAREVRARACCRVDLAGGTLDIWPLGILHPDSATVNVAIDLEAEVVIRARDRGYRLVTGDGAIDFDTLDEMVEDDQSSLIGRVLSELELPPAGLEVASGSPRGAGLGGSSALTIALIAAAERFLDAPESGPEWRSAFARDLEARLMQLPTGRQDHYPALLGGALEIRHRPGGESVTRLDVDLTELAQSLVVAYTGVSHFSARNNWDVIRRRLDGERGSVELFDGIGAIAASMAAPLENGDLARVGRLMAQEWRLRRKLAPAVSTPLIEDLLRVGEASGAWGGKACGAGGGGCVALLCPGAEKERLGEALAALGAQILEARPSPRPVSVTESG